MIRTDLVTDDDEKHRRRFILVGLVGDLGGGVIVRVCVAVCVAGV